MLPILQFFSEGKLDIYKLLTSAFEEQAQFDRELTQKVQGISNLNAVRSAEDGKTLLHFAAGGGMIKAMELLIQQGADINNQENPEENTPLLYAIKCHQFNAVKCLFEAGADKEIIDWVGYTPLERAVLAPVTEETMDSSIRIIELLIQAGVDINAKNSFDQSTVLHQAIKANQNVKLIKPLLAAEALIANSKNIEDQTPYDCVLALVKNEERNVDELRNALAIKEALVSCGHKLTIDDSNKVRIGKKRGGL